MKKKEMNGKDLLLSFLYSPGINEKTCEPIIGRTKLTKMMFLFEKQIYPKFFKSKIEIELPDFEPYLFGPFSRQLFEDLSFFESIGMIKTEETNIPVLPVDEVEGKEYCDDEDEWGEAVLDGKNEKYELSYFLSNIGIKYVEENVWPLFTSEQKKILADFKAQINRISLSSLLMYVYKKYPDQTVNSVIVSSVMKNGSLTDAGN